MTNKDRGQRAYQDFDRRLCHSVRKSIMSWRPDRPQVAGTGAGVCRGTPTGTGLEPSNWARCSKTAATAAAILLVRGVSIIRLLGRRPGRLRWCGAGPGDLCPLGVRVGAVFRVPAGVPGRPTKRDLDVSVLERSVSRTSASYEPLANTARTLAPPWPCARSRCLRLDSKYTLSPSRSTIRSFSNRSSASPFRISRNSSPSWL